MKALLLTFLLATWPAHEFYLSLMQMDHRPERQTIEVSIKVFTDDLIAALEEAGAPPMNIATPAEHEDADQYVERYLQLHLEVEVNGQHKKLHYIGKETEAEAVWCYMEISDVAELNSLKVRNTLLHEMFDSQVNMVNINANGRQRSGLARNGSAELEFIY